MPIYNINPQAKPRMSRGDKWKKRPAVLRYWEFKDKCKELGIVPEDNQYVIFHIPMAKSWSKKKKAEMDGKPHRNRPDLDNLLKGLWDILEEDSHISCVTARKVWAYDGAIEIHNMGPREIDF